ncbi:MAG: hypothetical protein ABWK01_09320 [Infirmifilum sp.]
MIVDDQALSSIARGGIALKLYPNEWEVISAATKALTISKISEATKLPYSTVIDVVKRLAKRNINLSFVPNYEKIGLKSLFLLFEEKPIRNFPVYTLSVYKIIGRKRYLGVEALVPERYLDDYISLFSGEPAYSLSTFEVKYWTPLGKLTQYYPRLGLLLPDSKHLMDVLREASVPPSPQEKKWIDWVDLVVLYFKVKYAFTKLSSMLTLVRQFFGVDPPSRQLMSYHYRTHVTALWSYNCPTFRLNTSLIPLKLFVFGGKEGETAARVLVQAPYMYEALVGESTAVVLGQPPSYLEPLIHTVMNMTTPELLFGPLLISSERSTPWITAKVVESYRVKGEFPDPTVDGFSFENIY